MNGEKGPSIDLVCWIILLRKILNAKRILFFTLDIQDKKNIKWSRTNYCCSSISMEIQAHIKGNISWTDFFLTPYMCSLYFWFNSRIRKFFSAFV